MKYFSQNWTCLGKPPTLTHTHTRTHTFSLLRGVGTVYRCLSLMYFSFFIQGHLLLLPSKQHGRSVEAESWEMKCNEGTTFIKYIFKIGRPARRPPPNLRGCPHVPPPTTTIFVHICIKALFRQQICNFINLEVGVPPKPRQSKSK